MRVSGVSELYPTRLPDVAPKAFAQRRSLSHRRQTNLAEGGRMTCRKCFLMMMRQRCGVSIKDHVVASSRDFFSPHRCAGDAVPSHLSLRLRHDSPPFHLITQHTIATSHTHHTPHTPLADALEVLLATQVCRGYVGALPPL